MSDARRATVASFLVAFLLAGCLGNDDGEELLDPGVDVDADAAAGPGGDGSAGLLPEWAVGDWWVFEGMDGVRTTFVVSEDLGADWRMDVDGEAYAFYDALTDISTLGPQRKSDLAGSQGTDRVEFFRWPLADGASWSTSWDQVTVTIRVVARDDGTFGFLAERADGTPHAVYSYSPDVRWFTQLAFFNPDGTPQFVSSVVDNGRDWTGNVLRYALDEVLAVSSADATGPTNVQLVEFTEPESATDVFLSLTAECTTGVFHFSLEPESESGGDPGYTTDPGVCPARHVFDGTVGHQPGQWGITLAYASPPDDIPVFSARVLVGTLSEIAVG